MIRYFNVPKKTLFVTLVLMLASRTAGGQVAPEVVASDLRAPQGIAVDERGWVWVAEQGTGNDDARISVITPEGEVATFIDGMPSNIVQGFPEGAHHLSFRDGHLWATLGLGEESPDGYLLIVDTTGFTPGQTPLSLEDVDQQEDVATFVIGHEFDDDTNQSNIYNLAFGPEDDLFVVDASANAVLRRTAEGGDWTVFATLPPVANPTPVGPPMSQAVPTGIVYDGERLLVSCLPGFPMPDGEGRILELGSDGSTSLLVSGLTTVVDLQLSPRGDLVASQFGAFSLESGFAANAGSIVRIDGTEIDTLVTGLSHPAGIAFGPGGDLYVTAMTDGQVLKVDAGAIGTSAEDPQTVPETFTLLPNYPNPFNPGTTLAYRLAQPEHISLSVYNLLGQEVRLLVDTRQPAGAYEVRWNGRDRDGRPMPSGVYLYRLRAGDRVQSRTMHLIK
ncbi:MAG TPA: ScyD/ScyE family protein [Thermomicrobiales bacterium]|nr:ScyD/ScyE family protein [Thermomicrobiales bacterium]